MRLEISKAKTRQRATPVVVTSGNTVVRYTGSLTAMQLAKQTQGLGRVREESRCVNAQVRPFVAVRSHVYTPWTNTSSKVAPSSNCSGGNRHTIDSTLQCQHRDGEYVTLFLFLPSPSLNLSPLLLPTPVPLLLPNSVT